MGFVVTFPDAYRWKSDSFGKRIRGGCLCDVAFEDESRPYGDDAHQLCLRARQQVLQRGNC